MVEMGRITNLSDVAGGEELSQLELLHHADKSGFSSSGFFLSSFFPPHTRVEKKLLHDLNHFEVKMKIHIQIFEALNRYCFTLFNFHVHFMRI